ncbi:MAG: hypothetical protein KDD10_17675 [Phaeodactylibacter sp.]|nr:hypothetical protein [Phaeodactylibacter sp.]MCB9294054.1 hypothetical protein [Lewinellaceae bacterium]
MSLSAGSAQHFQRAHLEFHLVASDGSQPQVLLQLEEALDGACLQELFSPDQRALIQV